MVVNNMDKNPEEYVVARMSSDGELWFWGSWDKFDDAFNVSLELGENAHVIPRKEIVN